MNRIHWLRLLLYVPSLLPLLDPWLEFCWGDVHASLPCQEFYRTLHSFRKDPRGP
jgi:hypothetical protein